jgi:hypothetical protein
MAAWAPDYFSNTFAFISTVGTDQARPLIWISSHERLIGSIELR